MALVDIIDSVTPGWAKARPHWWTLFRLGAVVVDGLLEGLYQARRASMPNAIDVPGVPGYGGFEDVGALDKIGRDLGVIRGLTESPPDYAFRLRHAHDPAAGGWEGPAIVQMFEQLAGVLGPNPPVMRIVYLDTSTWWTRETDGTLRWQNTAGQGLNYNADGTITQNTTASVGIDWDSVSVPQPPDWGYAGRWILIVYEPVNTPYGTSGPYTFNSGAVLGHEWNSLTTTGSEPDPDAATWGTNSPAKLVSVVTGVVAQRRMVGFECIWIVVCTDTSQFLPDGSSVLPAGALGTAYPQGEWAWHTKIDGNTRIIARNSTATYWKGPT